MRISAFISLSISVFMLIHGALQLFVVDPQVASQSWYMTNILFFYPILALFFTFLILITVVAYIQSGRSLSEILGGKRKKSRKRASIQPLGRSAFEIFMLSSLIFSALGTFKHDSVLYGAGVLMFLLPVFLDPYMSGRVEELPPENPRRMNWEMIGALIAFIALVWSLLVHYGIIP